MTVEIGEDVIQLVHAYMRVRVREEMATKFNEEEIRLAVIIGQLSNNTLLRSYSIGLEIITDGLPRKKIEVLVVFEIPERFIKNSLDGIVEILSTSIKYNPFTNELNKCFSIRELK